MKPGLVGHRSRHQVVRHTVLVVVLRIVLEVEELHTVLGVGGLHVDLEAVLHIVLVEGAHHTGPEGVVRHTGLAEVHHTVPVEVARHTGLEVAPRTDQAGELHIVPVEGEHRTVLEGEGRHIGLGEEHHIDQVEVRHTVPVAAGRSLAGEDTVDFALGVVVDSRAEEVGRNLEAGELRAISMCST
jgi:hypothetical protein